MGRHASWLVSALLGALVLTGCGNDADRTPVDSTGASVHVVPTAEPAPAPTVQPPPQPQPQQNPPTTAPDPFYAAVRTIQALPSLGSGSRGMVRLSLRLHEDPWQEVAVVQTALNIVAGELLTVDGYYGPSTEAAVQRYQRDNNLAIDGVIGPETMLALIGDLSDDGGAVPPPVARWAMPTPTATSGFGQTVCSDGWVSTSTGSGTCSHHGGIR